MTIVQSLRSGARLPVLSFIVAAVLLVVSCSGEPPSILRVFWQLSLVNDLEIGTRYETLTAFLLVEDSDGIEDIDAVYLLNDENELYWTLTPDEWEMYEEAGETWIGSNRILMHGEETFPRGNYRLLVVDKAGERDGEGLFVSTKVIDVDSVEFPMVQVSDGAVVLSGRHSTHTLRFYDDAREVVKLFSTDGKRIPIASVLNASELGRARRLYVYTFDDSLGAGLISGPYHLR